MLDVYLYGTASRISPEAPVPVVSAEKKDALPGGAANVMKNLVAVGCQVFGAGFLGKDPEGDTLIRQLLELGVNAECICESSLGTIHKTRVLANRQHIVRFDFDSDFSTIEQEKQQLFEMLWSLICTKEFDAIVVSDYSKGTINSNILTMLKRHVNCPIICDIKPHHKEMFSEVWAITPNLQEAKDILGHQAKNMKPIEIAKQLKKEMNLQVVIITMADQGILCIDEFDQEVSFPAYVEVLGDSKHRLDVTGAGDTVISVFTACIAAGIETHQAVNLANVAAGIVVRKIGTATCGFDEILLELDKHEGITAQI